jgi:DNA-binding IclR family transcriptional regulator
MKPHRSASLSGRPARSGSGDASALARGLQILDLAQERGRLKAHDVARELDLPVSTAYRYLRQLREAGYLVELDGYILPSERFADPDPGHAPAHLARSASPVLARLRQQMNASAVLTVRVWTAALCLDVSLAPTRYRRLTLHQGAVRALYAGASVTPLLAFAPPAVVKEVLNGNLRRFTSSTPSQGELRDELARIREDGYAFSHGALDPGLAAVGIPVLVDGRCLCALSVVGDERALAVPGPAVAALREAAAELLARIPRMTAFDWNSGDEL